METCIPLTQKDGTKELFTFNDAQMHLARIVAEDMDAGRPVWLIVVKGRQMGISMWVEFFLLAVAALSESNGQEFKSALVAHDDAAATRVFSYYRAAVDSLPPGFDRAALPISAWNLAECRWEGGTQHRIYSIKTGGGLGLGGRLNAVHYTEAGNYADKGLDAQTAYEAVQGCIHKPGSIVVIESTANGRDPFFWRLVEQTRRGENDFRLVFLPWFLESTYEIKWADYRKSRLSARKADPGYALQPTEEENALRASVGHPVPPSQMDWRWCVEVTDDQLAWRRQQCQNDYAGSFERMERFYPSTLDGAFATTESTFFTADEMARFASMVREPIARGNARADEQGVVTWCPDPMGFTRLWEAPLSGERYLVCADVAEGRGADFSAGYVLKLGRRWEVVAALHTQAPWEMTAVALHALAVYYNQAVLAIDNKPASIVEWIARMNYPRLYYHRSEARWGQGAATVPGFSITSLTRPLLLDAIARAVREELLHCPDPGFAQEMSTFVYVERSGKYEATWNSNDDRIMSMAIGCYLAQGPAKVGFPVGPAGVTEPADAMLEQLRQFMRVCGYSVGGQEIPSL